LAFMLDSFFAFLVCQGPEGLWWNSFCATPRIPIYDGCL